MHEFFLRLDDACETMDFGKWHQIENLLKKHEVAPLVAVIPENADPDLKKNERNDSAFEECLFRWIAQSWEIGIHGYDHILRESSKGLVGINKFSEFVDVKLEKQYEKIDKSLKNFRQRGIAANFWVAPAHGLDINTLVSLKLLSPNLIISDGLSYRPYTRFGIRWLPQQLWNPHLPYFGTWTLCLHPNEMTEENFEALDKFLILNRANVKNFSQATNLDYQQYNFKDEGFRYSYFAIRKMKSFLR